MLTPISTKIEEFDFLWYRDDVKRGLYDGKLDRSYFTDFLRTALEQRDKEWREIVEKEIEKHKYTGHEYIVTDGSDSYNAGLYKTLSILSSLQEKQ